MVQSKYIAACYCRLSKDDAQDGTSVSIETQQKILADYCNTHDIEVYDDYCDDGWSGTNFARPNFERMISDMENGKFNCVVVKDLSRFGRNYIEVGRYLEDVFPEKGIRFIAIGDNVDSAQDSMDADLMLPMRNVFNQFYPADISRKTRQAFRTKAQHGEFIGTYAPYGYHKSPDNKNVLVIDEITAPTVKRIFEMIAYENCGCHRIAKVLSDQKILTPAAYQAQNSGRSLPKYPYLWNQATVQKMITNQVYLGHIVNGKCKKLSFKSKRVLQQPEEKWIVVQNMHEPIVSQQLYDDANDQLHKRKRKRKNAEPHLFSGIARCADCGFAMSHTPEPHGRDFLCCVNYKQRGKEVCTSHYVRYDALYNIVLADVQRQVAAIHANEGKVSKLLKDRASQMKQSDMRRAEKEIQTAEKRIAELDDRYYKMYEDKLSGLLSEERFKEMSLRFENEQSDLRAKVDKLKAELAESKENHANVDCFIHEVKQVEDISELDAELLHRLISKITIGAKYEVDGKKKQNIVIEYKFVGQGI